MQPFEFANARSLSEALGLLGNTWDDAQVLAGGTDLINLMKDGIVRTKRLVDIKNISDIGGIRSSNDGLNIGATVTLDELTENSQLRRSFPALFQAALAVASPQIRNMGTIGGDLCLRPQCWYFRHGFGLLARDKDGRSLIPGGQNRYAAILGNSGPAYFVSASRLGPPLVALGAEVTIASPSGSRVLSIEELFVTPTSDMMREVALRPNELVTHIRIPYSDTLNATHEVQEKSGLDWPLVTASVAVRITRRRISYAKLVLGQVAPVPWVSAAASSLIGKAVTENLAKQASEECLSEARPFSQNGYKVPMAKEVMRLALLESFNLG